METEASAPILSDPSKFPRSITKLDPPPPAPAFNPGVGDIARLSQLGFEILHFERLLAVLAAPLLVAVEQLGCGDFIAGCDVHHFGDKPFQMIHLLLPGFGG
jgi:hypothetical protein